MDVGTQRVAGLMAEASRGRMLACLMDGRARTAKELAFSANVTPATASSHLAKLVGGEVLTVETQGRHRYFRIARQDVADALEALMTVAGRVAVKHPEEIPATSLPPLQQARFCYDHLAGRLGVELLAALLRARVVTARDKDFELTRRGEKTLRAAGVAVDSARAARRRFATACLDWSERRPHLGGALGREIAATCLAEKWIRRREGTRGVTLTAPGRKELVARFGLVWPE